ncbi:hypothetical protein D3C75_692510 [compost metagenome]
MRRGRCEYHHRIQLFMAFFKQQHGIAIDIYWRNAPLLPGLDINGLVPAKTPGNQSEMPIHLTGDFMCLADRGIHTTTDKPQRKWLKHHNILHIH